MAGFAHKAAVLAAVLQGATAQAEGMYDDCVVGTTNMWMPSPDTGACFCGGDKPMMCRPYPEYLGLNRAMCDKRASDIGVGTSSDSGAICGYFCNCAKATVVNDKMTDVTCCRAGSKYGLKNHTVIGEDVATTNKTLTAADFLPVPSKSFVGASLSGMSMLAGVVAVHM